MATTIQDPNLPIAPVAPAPVAAPVAAVAPSPEQVSQSLGTKATPYLTTPVNPGAVYSASNIQAVNTNSNKSLQDMKIGDLEKKIANATSTAEMNQINIGNQTVGMGVITGQQAHQSKLDTARLNAMTGMYQVKLEDIKRKEAERQDFISKYGADPDNRPKGMSTREYSAALQSGRFSHLQTKEFKDKVAANAMDLALKQKQLADTSAPGANKELAATAQAFEQFGGDWGKTANYLASKGYDVSSGSAIDNELRRRNGLPPVQVLTTAQQQAASEAQTSKQTMVPKLEDKVKSLDSLINDSYLNTAVGPNTVARTSLSSWLTGGKQNFLAGVKNIISQETLDTLLLLKAQGGTLGALSDQERMMLQNAASKIGGWEVKDKDGNVIGYNVNEGDFKKELAKIKQSTERVLNAARGVSNNDPLGLGF